MKNKKLKLVFMCGSILLACTKNEIPPVEESSHSNTSGSFELIQKTILTKSCATPGCHSSVNDATYKQHKLVLKGVDVYKALINGNVANAKALEAGLKQVVPKNAEESFFYQKLNFNNSKYKFGNAMPLGADALTANQLKFVQDWINAGAPETGHVANEELLH